MAKLIYAILASLDGYVADEKGNFDWAAPDEDVHAAINALAHPTAIFLLGRRMYEVLVAWETMDVAGEPRVVSDFADIWRAADKVVYSRTLTSVSSARTRVERAFDPDAIRRLKESTSRDISIGGPELAGQALRAGLLDECHLFLMPLVVGGGKRFLPDGTRADLRLLSERRFASGAVHIGYRVNTASSS